MPPTPSQTTLRTRVYIDGFNFYYGCLKGTPWKWLDLAVLFEQHILPSILHNYNGQNAQHQLLPLAIKYFTAKILDQAAKAPDSVSAQARYHTALRKLYDGRIGLIEGYYSMTEAKVKRIDPAKPNQWPRECDDILAWKLEEKQSDVNLALHAYHDAISGEIDQAIVVTNDTDIEPALKMIRANTGVTVGLVIPTRSNTRLPNASLTTHAHWVRRHIADAELAASQLPRVIGGRNPTIKPESWYARPDLLEQVLQMAIPVLGGRGKAFKWMEQANPYLAGAAPIDLVETEQGAAQVVAYIEAYVSQIAAPPAPD